MHDSNATHAGRSYVDIVPIVEPASFDIVDDISPDPLVTLHASSSCSLPSPSLKCHNS